MRDYLLEKICDLESWLGSTGKKPMFWPLAALGFVLLIVAMLVSNLFAVAAMIGGVFVKKQAVPAILELEQSEKLAEIIAGSQHVLVDFWAAWCGPCMMMKPALHAVADQFAGDLVVVMVDTSKFAELSKTYSVAGLPSLLFFENGQLIEQHAGALSESHLAEMIRGQFKNL